MSKVGQDIANEVVTAGASAPLVEVAQEMLAFGRPAVAMCETGESKDMIGNRGIVVNVVALPRSSEGVAGISPMSNHRLAVSQNDDVWHATGSMAIGGRRLSTSGGPTQAGRALQPVAATVFARTAEAQPSRHSQ